MPGSFARGSTLCFALVVSVLILAVTATAEARSPDSDPPGPMTPPKASGGSWTAPEASPPLTPAPPLLPPRDPSSTDEPGSEDASRTSPECGPRPGLCAPGEGSGASTAATGRRLDRREAGESISVDRERRPRDHEASDRSRGVEGTLEGGSFLPHWEAAFRNISRLVFF
jgi:hypothetical protein